MSRTLRNVKVALDQSLEDQLGWLAPGYAHFRILRESVDARQRHSPHLVYSVEVFDHHEAPDVAPITVEKRSGWTGRPVILVGAGPAGLFAALRLAERGIPSILLEQGDDAGQRVRQIGRYWRYGELNPQSNVGFGEGGAGLFSDGKLITRIKSPHIPYVMQRLVRFGAPKEIEYLSNPHVGSDRIRRVIPVMREHLRALGVTVRFGAKVEGLLFSGASIRGVRLGNGEEIESERVMLATGHSAEDMFEHLVESGVAVEGKSFAVGLRIEHPQAHINRIQYREHADHPKLGAANYRLAYHDDVDKVGVYSFCMCPGGYVLSAATGAGGMVCNGMSNFNRGSRFANAAVVVSLDHAGSFGTDVFGGLKFRRRLEAQALEMVRSAKGTREVPAQRLTDFLAGRSGSVAESSSPSGVVPTRLDDLFDKTFRSHFRRGLENFDRGMKGFVSEEAMLHGVESRTSCPVRVVRDPVSMQSLSHRGLYPAGEGAGYAGGITSAACDGVRIADVIAAESN